VSQIQAGSPIQVSGLQWFVQIEAGSPVEAAANISRVNITLRYSYQVHVHVLDDVHATNSLACTTILMSLMLVKYILKPMDETSVVVHSL